MAWEVSATLGIDPKVTVISYHPTHSLCGTRKDDWNPPGMTGEGQSQRQQSNPSDHLLCLTLPLRLSKPTFLRGASH